MVNPRYFIKSASSATILTIEQERELGRRIKTSDAAAWEELYNSNQGLVRSIASRYLGDFDYLVNAGRMGLARAIEKYDPSRQNRFGTYAGWWIHKEIQRSLLNEYAIRVPAYMRLLVSRIVGARRKFFRECEREPSNLELAELLNKNGKVPYPVKTLSQAIEVSYLLKPISLDFQVTEDGNTLGDLLTDPKEPRAEEQIVRAEQAEQLELAVESLEPLEKKVITLKLGLNGHSAISNNAEIGRIIGLSREWVRKIEGRAVSKLKAQLQSY